MEIIKPDYYGRFHCIAGDCPDSCCKEWEVDIDPEAAARYRELSGDLGDRLRQVLREEDGCVCMTIENGRCPMWREDGLCRIQAELGHDALSVTCRDFPRLRHDYGDFVELDLELSCPEASRLIFSGLSTMEKQIVPGGQPAEYDPEIMQILLRSRQEICELLAEDARPVNELLAILLLRAYEVQGEIDGAEHMPWNADTCLAEAGKYAKTPDTDSVIAFFRELEILTDRWKQRLESAQHSGGWDNRLRLLVAYLIRRYWLQAVSDYDLVCRAKFIVITCLLVNMLGGDLQQTAQLFSKEIENDPDNVEAILDGAYTAPAFSDANVLGLLLFGA